MYRLDVSYFDKVMGINGVEENLESIVAMQDAEDAFEQQIEHAMRSVQLANEAEEILASLIKSWQSVIRTRTMAGF